MQLKYSKELMDTLSQVNSDVNSFPYITEDWDGLLNLSDLRKAKHGTCADFAYTKMLELVEKGLDSSGMGICSCITETNEAHAVLIVSTTEGDFVLDQRSGAVDGFGDVSILYKWTYIPDYLKGNQ